MGFAPFQGTFEHCAYAVAAGDATESAVLETGVSENIARAASQAAAQSAAESLKEGKSPEEAAIAAATAAFEAVDKKGANKKEAMRAAAAAGAAAAAAAGSTSEADAEIATKAAANAVAMNEPGNADKLALEYGGSQSAASNAASGAAIGEKAAGDLKDDTPESELRGPEPPGDNATGQNIEPVADGGDDQTVLANTEVTLDGSKSIDTDGTLVSYKWKQTGGPEVHIKDSNKAMASFNAPSVSEDSKLAFKLTVKDDQGAPKSDKVSIKVESNTESGPIEDESNTESGPIEDQNNTES